MRLNEKNVASFAVCSSPVDREGYLQKKGDVNRDFQRRWFVLKGNLLFYFQKKQDREPQGVIVLEACSVQVSVHGRYSFEISFDGSGTRVYILGADNDDDMQSWMKAISHASYEYLKSIVDELQRRVNVLSSSSTSHSASSGMEVLGIGAVPASQPKSTVSKETSVTFQELCNPIAPHERRPPSTKIKKGILVDISDEETAPPIPAKKKGVSVHHASNQVASGEGLTDKLTVESNIDHTNHSPSSSKPGKLHPPHLPAPYSSPMRPSAPIENTSKPLSPPAMLDRTSILQPSPVSVSPRATTMPTLEEGMAKLTMDIDDSLSPTSLHQNGMERVGSVKMGSTEPSSHPPQATRKLAAPLDTNKSFIEMHEDFTQAMKALNAERTGSTNYVP